ncbi:MAG TPA: hypothetical protein VFM54_20655, partial [Micromonosporaceae bacterium]|nr:hypothetical protein [Micromonosporaceae bacterium]
AARYGLTGQVVPIAVAYGGHLAYGYPLGVLAQRFDLTATALRRAGRYTVTVLLVGAVVLVTGWHRPWEVPALEREAAALRSGSGMPAVIVRRDRFVPEWLRVRQGGCVVVDNRSATGYATRYGDVAPKARSTLCFPVAGTQRVRLGTRPYAGGFVYVDAGRRR